ncbi:MAG: hypothetical protein AB7K09_22630 [Planctomycetota bacterium]
MARFLILIPDGVGVRNFLCSGVASQLAQRGEVEVWHPFDGGSTVAELYSAARGSVSQWSPLPSASELTLPRLLRHAKVLAHLHRHSGEDFNQLSIDLIHRNRRVAVRVLNAVAEALARCNASDEGVATLHQWHEWSVRRGPEYRQARTRLIERRPDVVFCTHQRALLAVPVMAAARELGIPAATFVYSWDNLPKGRMAVHADHVLVWSEHMAAEMARYSPDHPAGCVHITGTPQFEPYFDRSLAEPRDQFLCRHGVDPADFVVCFSGDDTLTSPNDPLYLEALAIATAGLTVSGRRVSILFRRCPADGTQRFARVLAQHSGIAVSDPLWSKSLDWSTSIPTRADNALLANVVRHSDLVVNLGSTMAADFAVLGKPAIFVAWDALPNQWPSTAELYRLPHFRLVDECGPVYRATGPEHLRELVVQALSEPEQLASARETFLRKLALHPMEDASTRIAEALLRIAGRAEHLHQ